MEPAEAHGWQVTRTRTAYENPWIRVREDEVVRPDGSAGLYGVVQLRRPAVFVVALTDDDAVLVVELYRYATHLKSLTQGRGLHAHRMAHHDAMPKAVQDRVVAEAGTAHDEDE